MPKAAAFVRFSTTECPAGASPRRQRELPREWPEALVRGHAESEAKSWRAKEAWRRQKLCAAIAAVQQGEIPPGTVLIVEDLSDLPRGG